MEFVSIVGLEHSGENTNYCFPTFYYSNNGKRFYFKGTSLELGSINFVVGERKTGKSLFLRSLTGLECPKEKPIDRKFLKYDIVYKPEFIEPKFNGKLNELIKRRNLDENTNFMQNINSLSLNNYLNVNVKSLDEEQKQLLSFVLFLATEGLIYIMDCPTHLISVDKRKKMLSIFKKYCEKNDKIGVITEENMTLIDEIFDDKIDSKYIIKKFGENEFYGGNMIIQN